MIQNVNFLQKPAPGSTKRCVREAEMGVFVFMAICILRLESAACMPISRTCNWLELRSRFNSRFCHGLACGCSMTSGRGWPVRAIRGVPPNQSLSLCPQ